ncbi:GNAT family N-acetyltransferase [Streptomyces sp. NPDC054949]
MAGVHRGGQAATGAAPLPCRPLRNGDRRLPLWPRDKVVTLGPMYLLDVARGQGVGGRMMGEFLTWAGTSPMRLWVTEYRVQAIRFYERHGFRTTTEREIWRGRLPNVRMTRDPV